MTLPAGPARDPVVEERRQRAVESLQLSEGQKEERFERITRLARTVFSVPMTTITILDDDRAWFPSSQGIDVDEIPREDTFCDRTTDEGQLLVVEDATQDDRFRHLPIVEHGNMRFYAGHPLRDAIGNVVGTFCIYDTEPRTLEGDLLVAFRDIAAWAEQELVSSTEMLQAGRVQASMLPARAVRVGGWEISGLCLPALAVGGDFYDYGVTNGVVHLGLGDVMGKGTGAALVGAGVRAAIRSTHAAVTAGVDLGITATQVARSLLPDLERTESFVTLFEAAIDLEDGFTRYVDAGAGLCLLIHGDGSEERLKSKDRPFGILPDDHWSEHQVNLDPGSRMLIFSDGLLDLIDDPIEWWHDVGALMRKADDVDSVLDLVARLARDRTALDDVTAVAVFRAPLERSPR
ncbi:SpoIIE family protein phosphatase [Aeromicrobium sp.]|uniref:PP2C family protein-serine/threonine phosphatase n=1 Tax=Aeromicrobium sp. TaxID=1871063 RepID=UPI0019B792DC|nr:SpoIIE family protein phosphatase [Aeromicrobium sp.]MBC7632225.1 SpoIIE family protein phosphatase [Aeromicrobium sp.]